MTGIGCGHVGPDLHSHCLLPAESATRGPSPGSPEGGSWSTVGLHPRAATPSQSLRGGAFSQNQKAGPGGSWQPPPATLTAPGDPRAHPSWTAPGYRSKAPPPSLSSDFPEGTCSVSVTYLLSPTHHQRGSTELQRAQRRKCGEGWHHRGKGSRKGGY